MEKKRRKYGLMLTIGGIGVTDDEYYMFWILRFNIKGSVVYCFCLKWFYRLILGM